MFYKLSAGEYEKALIHNKVDENSIVESTCEELMSWEKKVSILNFMIVYNILFFVLTFCFNAFNWLFFYFSFLFILVTVSV